MWSVGLTLIHLLGRDVVPNEMLETVVLALQMIILAFRESSEKELRHASWYFPHSKPGQINNILVRRATS